MGAEDGKQLGERVAPTDEIGAFTVDATGTPKPELVEEIGVPQASTTACQDRQSGRANSDQDPWVSGLEFD